MTRHDLCKDKTRLVSYLYNECDEAERRTVDSHLADCAECAAEFAGLRAVRSSLSQWQVSERALGIRVSAQDVAVDGSAEESPRIVPRSRWTLPWWMQTAAAVVLFAAAVGLARIEIRYGPDGVVVRTGWSATPAPAPSSTQAAAPWRQDLVALEKQLRHDLTPQVLQPVTTPEIRVRPLNEDVLLRRVQELIDQSERKQQRELAMRLADVVRDVDIQRRADQIRVQQTVGELEGQTGVAVKQNRELLNYLVRVSQQR